MVTKMNEKKVCLIITIVGILIIILIQTLIMIDDDKLKKEENYIKENLIEISKKCIQDKKCKEEDILLETLLNENYIDGHLKEKLNTYSKKSIIKYPSFEVELIKED